MNFKTEPSKIPYERKTRLLTLKGAFCLELALCRVSRTDYLNAMPQDLRNYEPGTRNEDSGILHLFHHKFTPSHQIVVCIYFQCVTTGGVIRSFIVEVSELLLSIVKKDIL